MTKTILLPSVAIATVSLAAMVGGVLALWTEQLNVGVTMTTGSVVLKLKDTDESLESTVSDSFGGTVLAPGDVLMGWIMLRNTGTVPADHVDATFSNQVVEAAQSPGSDPTTPLDTVLEIQSFKYDWVNLVLPPDSNANGIVDLDDLENWNQEGVEDLVDLPLTDIDTDHILTLVIRFHPGLGENEHQGDVVTVNVDFTLNQAASQ